MKWSDNWITGITVSALFISFNRYVHQITNHRLFASSFFFDYLQPSVWSFSQSQYLRPSVHSFNPFPHLVAVNGVLLPTKNCNRRQLTTCIQRLFSLTGPAFLLHAISVSFSSEDCLLNSISLGNDSAETNSTSTEHSVGWERSQFLLVRYWYDVKTKISTDASPKNTSITPMF